MEEEEGTGWQQKEPDRRDRMAEAEGTGWLRRKGPDGRTSSIIEGESKIEGESEQCGRIEGRREQGNHAADVRHVEGNATEIEAALQKGGKRAEGKKGREEGNGHPQTGMAEGKGTNRKGPDAYLSLIFILLLLFWAYTSTCCCSPPRAD